ncbi:MAG: hypothetical protein HYS12_09800 [Planctomycetes bacterium]|nr:hypothetical protein [Planctomycetota bacterium]
MKRLLLVGALLLGACAFIPVSPAADSEREQAKEALKALQDFIGGWKGSGGPPRPRPGAPIWNETLDWSWRFKGDDVWLALKIEKGKHFKSGALRYLLDKKVYQLTAEDAKGKKRVFEGMLKNDYLTLERVDPETKESQKIVMNLAGDGVRFIYRYDHKDEGKTLWINDFQVASTKIGESLGATEKKQECVVSGGLGTVAVSFKGETFYVCCSGCRDEFNANPEKYVKEFKAKKAGKN